MKLFSLLFKLFLLIILVNNFYTANASDLESDSLALVALYDSTNGDGWTYNTGWKTDTVGAWFGIEMEQGRVVNIYLQGNNLVGNIPPAIGDLDSLQRLSMNGNNGLTDSLPPEIGNLKKLERFYIYNCSLTGTIPDEIGSMDNIQEIALNRNSLTGPIPTSLENLSSLTYLSLHTNNLSGKIPNEVGNITNLQHLILNNNELSDTIPSNLSNLSNLQTLNLYNNDLTGSIPAALFSMSNLTALRLAQNMLTGGIPAEIGDLTNLVTLDISYNPLGDTIPSQMGNMTNLQYLYAGGCELTGSVPAAIANLNQLVTLDMHYNQLTDTLPAQLGSMSSLQVINFYINQLDGEVPQEIGNLSNLEQLSLGSNNFTGNIPPELGNLSNLRYFELYGSEFIGSIPPELGKLTNLWSLVISENQLTGSIPSELGDLSSLRYFMVQNNQLTGTVPVELTNINSLERIHIRYNNLDDLPDFSTLPSIDQFHVENNKFTFGDLEFNFHVLDSYSPQDTIGTLDTIYYAANDTLELVTTTDGLYNKYQWTFNGSDISDNSKYSGTNDSLLLLMNPNASDIGYYSCKVTNDTVTGLTLYRNPIVVGPTVKVTSTLQSIQCSNDSITIDYKSFEVLSGNTFTAELSDSLGSFSNPTVLGLLTTTDSVGTIKGIVPDSISSGDMYKIRVNASNPAIVGQASTEMEIFKSNLMTPVLSPSEDSSICAGESLILSTDSVEILEYLWYRNDDVISGATSHTWSVNTEGVYHVKVYDICSIDSLSSNTINITVDPLPYIDLALNGLVLTATQSSYYSYVWYKDGVDLLVNDTVNEYTATESGEYWVVVTNENGCISTSNHKTVVISTLASTSIPGISLFPNPTKGRVDIRLEKDAFIECISVSDIAGNIIYEKNGDFCNSTDIQLDLSKHKAGIYFILIQTGDKQQKIKLIKQ